MRNSINLFRECLKGEVLKDLVIGTLASLIVALFAPLSFNLPFTPVPVTLQVQVALFLSAFLGARRGVFMILAFITQGVIGFPVFGYLIAAFLVGKVYQETLNKNVMKLFFSMFLGNICVYLCGFSWLSHFVGLKNAFLLGIAPFALLDLLKLTMFSFLKTPFTAFLNSLRK